MFDNLSLEQYEYSSMLNCIKTSFYLLYDEWRRPNTKVSFNIVLYNSNYIAIDNLFRTVFRTNYTKLKMY